MTNAEKKEHEQLRKLNQKYKESQNAMQFQMKRMQDEINELKARKPNVSGDSAKNEDVIRLQKRIEVTNVKLTKQAEQIATLECNAIFKDIAFQKREKRVEELNSYVEDLDEQLKTVKKGADDAVRFWFNESSKKIMAEKKLEELKEDLAYEKETSESYKKRNSVLRSIIENKDYELELADDAYKLADEAKKDKEIIMKVTLAKKYKLPIHEELSREDYKRWQFLEDKSKNEFVESLKLRIANLELSKQKDDMRISFDYENEKIEELKKIIKEVTK
jgi:uncharacterized protein YozE (UPF0346 family)